MWAADPSFEGLVDPDGPADAAAAGDGAAAAAVRCCPTLVHPRPRGSSCSSWSPAQLLDRRAVVRLGRLPQGVHHRADHQGPAVRRRRRCSPAARSPPAWSSPTAPGRSTPRCRPSRQPRPLPRGDRAAAPDRRRSSLPVVSACSPAPPPAGQWQTFLLWRNRVPFGVKDPQFGLDVGFFVFTLPWLRFVVGFLTMVLVLSPDRGRLHHYVYGGLQLQGGAGAPRPPRGCTCRCCSAVLVLRPGRQLLARPLLAGHQGLQARLTGMTYTDAHAVLPAKAILAVAARDVRRCCSSPRSGPARGGCPASASACCWSARSSSGGIYPALVQSFKVKPEREVAGGAVHRPQHHGDPRGVRAGGRRRPSRTRRRPRPPAASCATTPRRSPASGWSTRAVVLRHVQAAAAGPAVLRVPRLPRRRPLHDRRQVAATPWSPCASSNLSGIAAGQRNWLNDHTIYTHGFGVVAAYGNQRTDDGKPVFFEGDIPPIGALGRLEPRIYFGEQSPDYSIVGAPTGAAPRELDYPDSSAVGQQNTTYTGNGGVRIGSFARKLAYAIKYREQNFLLSNAVNSRVADPVRPRAARAGREGRAVADAGRQPLPGGRRRPGPVDPRRLHDVGQLPVLAADHARTARPPTR